MWEQIAANRRKSTLLVIGMALLLGALGYVLAEYFAGRGKGPYGLLLAGVVWLVMTLTAWFQGDRIYLTMARAHKIGKEDFPVLFNVVEEMTLAAGLPKIPDIYVIDDAAPNAFATGRRPETAAVAVTSGLLKTLTRDELQGVIGHELGHVRNRDIQLMLFAGVLAGAIVILADIGRRGLWFGGGRRSRRNNNSSGGGVESILMVVAVVLMILAPFLAQLIYFAISRKREYLADASSATFTRYPEGLASALEKISRDPAKLASANLATAPMYIINPLARQGKMAANGSSTHPPIDERIRILRSMAGSGFAAYDDSFKALKGGKGVIPGSALQGAGARVGSRAARPSASTAQGLDRAKARQVDNFFYQKGGYYNIKCECGTVLKIPPGLTLPKIRCPRCGREHSVKI